LVDTMERLVSAVEYRNAKQPTTSQVETSMFGMID
jgi:hypothetical protein